jgi:5-methylcytosine-specific restriction endonuclease McrA
MAMNRESVEATPRKAMSPARKLRIWSRWSGLCGECGDPVDALGPGVVYDHIVALWLGGPETDKNLMPLHRECDRVKTASDARVRAKIKRLHKKAAGFEKKGPRLQSRGFDKTRIRRFGGSVVRKGE